MSAALCEPNKFGRAPEFASNEEQLLEFAKRLRHACEDCWSLIDALGQKTEDETKLAILHSTQFATAAYNVKSALILTRSLEGR